MSSDESVVPDAKVAQKLVEQFAEITNTDEALAQFYLQDRHWDLQVLQFVNCYCKAYEQSTTTYA